MSFHTIDRSRIAYRVAQQIINQIQNGNLQPGEQLPSERELAKMMGVSRGTIREALSSLQGSNILMTKNGSGTYVNNLPLSKKATFKALASTLHNNSPIEILEAREALEEKNAFLAAENRTDHDLYEIERALYEQKSRLENNQNPRPADVKFHMAISRAAKNPILEQLTKTVFELMDQEYWDKLMHDMYIVIYDNDMEKSFYLKQHEMILKAIKERDGPKAQKLTLAHIELVKNDIYELNEAEMKGKEVIK